MSLHKQLVAAFGQPDPPLVGPIGSEVHEEDGYCWHKVGFSVVINASGELFDVEGPPWRLAGKRRKNSLLVPQKQFGGEGGFSGFLWGQSLHALGVGKDLRAGGLKTSLEAFNRFRTFHKAVLAGAENPSLRAFLLFLQRWEPAQGLALPAEVAGAAVVFRFRYEDCFLHETHAARMIWSRLLNPAGARAKPPAVQADTPEQG